MNTVAAVDSVTGSAGRSGKVHGSRAPWDADPCDAAGADSLDAAELAAAAADPASPVSGLGTVLDGGRAQPARLAFEEIVRPFGVVDRGITFLDGEQDRRVSYHELAGLAASVAARLRRAGIRTGTRVAMTIGNDLRSVVTVMGLWAAGATIVSVPAVLRRAADAAHGRHFGGLMRAMDCELVITAGDGTGAFADGALRRLPAETLCWDVQVGPAVDSEAAGTALVQFTSGSALAPKGVGVGAGKLAGHLETVSRELAVDPATDRFVSWLPLYHDMGLSLMFLNALASRAEMVLMPPRSFATGPGRWLEALSRCRGTITGAPNLAYRLAGAASHDPGIDLSSVRVSLSGGERLNWQTLVDFHRATEPLGMSWGSLMPCYGMAESVMGTTNSPLGRGPVRGPGGHVSVGTPLAGLRVQAPTGPPSGPITLAGDWLIDGYHTKDGFLASPGGWYDTEDHGFVHDGELYVVGRRGEMVTSDGRDIFAEDIEAVVYDAEGGGVRACAAFRLAEDDHRHGLMVELPTRPTPSPAEAFLLGTRVCAAVSSALAVSVQPVLVVSSGTIPRTTSGKVQRAQCRAMHSNDDLRDRLLATVA